MSRSPPPGKRGSGVKEALDERATADWHSKAVRLLTNLAQVIPTYVGNPQETSTLYTDFANLHDYYVYEILDATKATAPRLINLLSHLGQQSLQQNDPAHSVFFLTLMDFLKLKFEIGLPRDGTKRRDFERSFKETTRRLGLGEIRMSTENDDLIRKTRITSYVA